MSKNTANKKILYPGLGLVLGSSAGLLISTLFAIDPALGLIGGAALGLLLGIIVFNLWGK